MKCNSENRKHRTRSRAKQERRRARPAVGGCGRGQREQDKRLLSDSRAEELLANREINTFYFWWRSHEAPATLTSLPFLLFFCCFFDKSSFTETLLKTLGAFKRLSFSSARWETNRHTSDVAKKCLSLPLCAFMLMRDSVLHVCYSLAWMNIKYEADNIKYSASLGWKNERPAQISGQCVGVNYAGEQLLNGVSVSQEGTLSPAGLQGQDNIFFQLKMMQVPFPSRTLHILKPLCMERASSGGTFGCERV